MTPTLTFRERLRDPRPILADGAMGTQLHAHGVGLDSPFDELNLTHPDMVQAIHRAYVEAGADLIETNTFGANRFKLGEHGLADQVAAINRAGVELARAAIAEVLPLTPSTPSPDPFPKYGEGEQTPPADDVGARHAVPLQSTPLPQAEGEQNAGPQATPLHAWRGAEGEVSVGEGEQTAPAGAVTQHSALSTQHLVFVAGSVGPLGVALQPYGRLKPEDASAAFSEQIAALAGAGADALLFETFTDLAELRLALEAAREIAPDLPVITEMTFNSDDRTLHGYLPGRVAHELAEAGAEVIGVNCSGGPAQIARVLQSMRQSEPDVRLSAMPNAGYPKRTAGAPSTPRPSIISPTTR